ncbi:MAG: cupin domain-containing protein [Candidatus Eremiobacteraeota bacterium]|nr:cupin domain-containing protein [Candidatus Eremiobacteraeota bacterium]
MQPLAVPGFFSWSRWQPDRKMAFVSHLRVHESGNVAFDPLETDARETEEIEALGGVATILLTNRDHERGAAAMRQRFGARILAERKEADAFELTVDGVFEGGGPPFRSSRAPGVVEVVPGVTALALDGAKTLGEVVFYLPESRAAVVGDALIGQPAGMLGFLDDAKLGDPARLAVSLRRLWALEPETLLLGDGESVFAGVDEALGTLLETRGGPNVNRVNLDELTWTPFDRVGGRYRGEYAEIGLLIGARRLGYQMVRLPAGARFCPLHAHDREEEVFFVVDGAPSIRSSRGTLQLRAGDFMAFPVGDRGAHQLLNESDAEATVILFGQDDPDEVVYYPDSEKILVARRGLRMRADRLDYYDGE